MSKREVNLLLLLLFVGALISSYFAIERVVKYEVQYKINSLLDKFPGSASYEELSYSLLKNEVTIRNLSLSYQGYKVEASLLRVELPFSKKELFKNFTLIVKNLQVSSSIPYVKEFLKLADFNGEKLTVDAVLFLKGKKDRLRVAFYSQVKRFFFLGVLIDLEGKAERLRDLKMIKGEVDYKDKGFVRKFLFKQAKLCGEDVETFKKSLISSLKGDLPQPLFKPIKRFIENPQELKIKFIPYYPLSLKEIVVLFKETNSLNALLRKVKLEIVYNSH